MASTSRDGKQLSSKIPSAGIKQADGKLKVGLIPSQIIEGLASVYTWGCTGKVPPYPARNWEKGISFTEIYSATQRHLLAWWRREDNDQESGLSHLWHAMWGCGALAFYSLFSAKYLKFDDRPSHFTETWADEPTPKDTYLGTARYDGDIYPKTEEHKCWSGWSDGEAVNCNRIISQRNTRRHS